MSTVLTESEDPKDCVGEIAVKRFYGGDLIGMCFDFTTTEGKTFTISAKTIRDLAT